MNYELEKTQTQLAAAQERLELALEASELSLWDWDLLEQQVYHTRTEEILGLTTEQGQSMLLDLRPLVHPDDLKDLRKAMVGHLKGHTQEYYAEYRMRHADGHWVWIEDRGRVVERDEQGRALRMLGTRRDITKRLQNDEVLSAAQANSKKVKYLSEYDALTGLANRELFQQRLNESIAYSHDKTNRFALLHLDLDRFKVLNESLGVESA
ncbi:MAG: PAS domain-containing protein, partial [Gammaproteobacteria bacterium]|nr:PAS domain-containing protein [Gammaproteobacteria bacterium]